MLESIRRMKNFKSFADAEVKLAPVTVLVGANGSGKSNLLMRCGWFSGWNWDGR